MVYHRDPLPNGKLQRWNSVFLSMVLLFAVAPLESQEQTRSFDIVITNGRIIDGTGSPWYSADVGIRNSKIASIGNLSAAPRARTIDARGKVVAPGFIDMLGQSEYTILVDPRLPSKIYQGITTEITGEGESIAPLSDAILRADQEQYDHYHIHADWRTFREYFSRLEKQRIGINIASYVGATRESDQLFGFGVGCGRVFEGSGDADSAVAHRLAYQLFHLLKLAGVGCRSLSS